MEPLEPPPPWQIEELEKLRRQQRPQREPTPEPATIPLEEPLPHPSDEDDGPKQEPKRGVAIIDPPVVRPTLVFSKC
jgi:hypothetical protein